MTNFTNKTVLVTGASGGIGRAIAQEFAEAGASVVVHFNNNERAAQRTLESLKGESHRLIQADLTNPEELPNLVETVSKGMGKIDVLINNAGISKANKQSGKMYPKDKWDETLRINLTAHFSCSQEVIQYMKRQKQGSIINITSINAECQQKYIRKDGIFK